MILYSKYKSLQRKMIEETFNDPAMWKNDYPIVLVHGYCGTTMDENWILGGYFHYGFSKVSRYLNHSEGGIKTTTGGSEQYLSQVFEADVSPIGSAFDRACELY